MFTTLVAITMISDRHIGLVDIGQQGWWRQVHQMPPPPPLSMGLLSVASVQTDMYLSRRAHSSCLMEFIEVWCAVLMYSQYLVCYIYVQSVSGVLYWCTVSVWCAVLMYSQCLVCCADVQSLQSIGKDRPLCILVSYIQWHGSSSEIFPRNTCFIAVCVCFRWLN